MNRGGPNRRCKVSREARRELEVRLAVERVKSYILSHKKLTDSKTPWKG